MRLMALYLTASHGRECNMHLYLTAMVGSANGTLSHSHGRECNMHLMALYHASLSHSHGGECNMHLMALYHTAMVGSATCISITQSWGGGGGGGGSATCISISQPWWGVQHASLSHSHGGGGGSATCICSHAFIISTQKHITIECNIYQAIQALLSKPQWWKGVDLHSQPQGWMESSRRKVLICSLYRAKSLLCAAR